MTMIAIRSQPAAEVPSASEWTDSSEERMKRGLITHDLESVRLRAEISLASSHWAETEGKTSLKLREIVCVARSNVADDLIGRLMLLVSRGASIISFVIAGIAVAASIWTIYLHAYMPLITTVSIAFAFACAGWAQRVIGRRLVDVLRNHKEGDT